MRVVCKICQGQHPTYECKAKANKEGLGKSEPADRSEAERSAPSKLRVSSVPMAVEARIPPPSTKPRGRPRLQSPTSKRADYMRDYMRRKRAEMKEGK